MRKHAVNYSKILYVALVTVCFFAPETLWASCVGGCSSDQHCEYSICVSNTKACRNFAKYNTGGFAGSIFHDIFNNSVIDGNATWQNNTWNVNACYVEGTRYVEHYYNNPDATANPADLYNNCNLHYKISVVYDVEHNALDMGRVFFRCESCPEGYFPDIQQRDDSVHPECSAFGINDSHCYTARRCISWGDRTDRCSLGCNLIYPLMPPLINNCNINVSASSDWRNNGSGICKPSLTKTYTDSVGTFRLGDAICQ
ncbi:MAG: hypothetical protein K5912_03830 [Alphaproteobacteria bacterium]|nr:hypothetical protein [Alphaproteobacteria bacterium]